MTIITTTQPLLTVFSVQPPHITHPWCSRSLHVAATALPPRAGGLIYIVDHETYAVLDKYPIRCILFCAAGDPEETSLGFTMLEAESASRGDGSEGGPAERFECRVFDFPAQDKTQLALAQIAASFGKIDGSSAGGAGGSGSAANALRYTFEAAIAVAEEDPQKGGFSQCPVSKGSFKLRFVASPRRRAFALCCAMCL